MIRNLSTRAASGVLAAALAGCASKTLLVPVPEALAAPAGLVETLETSATGVQVYRCAPEGTRYAWRFEAPEAVLRDADGRVVGKHYAGPTWESTDGSAVVGEVRAKADSAEPGAIPQLLLHAKENRGNGIFSSVVNVQRLATHGGSAPAAGCDTAHADAVVRVPYRALYYFYSPR